ncbi:MAG: bifunctional phosphoribosylaminoimidazolecarboxamide formyltransferase/IMP cyclohydrolase [Myxococcota bacterium]|nr:bifunctional phosphoribosylaminoimidazolecarboxamide formyltransferase/IMP cyclohydrolase [Myxococcota bacterium]MDW8360810.1 bifunctional phosphoribosylaminoimidazolecarboxamide formyltransferase/IMP cyclohydrolase [Myxococcales bacterium]
MNRIRRALISVSDRRGLIELARALVTHGVEILSTGGTARALREHGVEATDVERYTGAPEILDGRVKTLHPRVHGGILARDLAEDRHQLAQIGGAPIDLVCVNLYPFEEALRAGATTTELVERIDVGGPAMVRAAAKNHARVTVLVDPDDYPVVIASLPGAPPDEIRRRLAARAFARTASYDAAIARWLASTVAESDSPWPETLVLAWRRAQVCRYGENPHQRAAFYIEPAPQPGSLAAARSLGAGGKELSYNNLVDLDAALEAVRDLEGPAAVIVKHATPCGAATAADLETAFRHAREADAQSAFGGIVALNRPCDASTAAALLESFVECVAAPAFEPDALERLRERRNLRIVETGPLPPPDARGTVIRSVGGGLLVADRDATAAGEVAAARVVSRRPPTQAERDALDFAWRICKHVRSNAIVIAREGRTVGIGGGQTSRVGAVEAALARAGAAAHGAVLASDGFFPFPDGVERALAAGVTAFVQPGGSVRDAEVVAAVDAAGATMLCTGVRHFRH